MKKLTQRILFPLSIVALILMFATPALAQSPISATVDRTTLTTDDILTLTVLVRTDNQPVMPDLAGFNLLSSSTSSQISIINGTMSTQIVYSYQLLPVQTGALTIEPISLTSNGQTTTTAPITVHVEQGTGRPAQRRTVPSGGAAMPNLQSLLNSMLGGGMGQIPSPGGGQGRGFADAEVSNPTPYLGEQIVYTVRYYQDAGDVFRPADPPQVIPPTFSGFWSETSDEQKQYRAQSKDGHIFNVTELTTVLIPAKVDELTIEPTRLSIPGGFFEPGAELATEPVTVNVKPLPAGAPASFSGAVGQFEIAANVNSPQSKVNEPVTWQINLTGSGNIKTMADPRWPDLPNWRSFDSKATVNTQVQNGHVTGARHYERLLVPQTPGDFTIPALEFSYFDPQTGQYQITGTQPIPVAVAPGNGGPGPQAGNPAPAGDGAQTGEGIAAGPQPYKPQSSRQVDLKPVPAALSPAGDPITNSPLYWLAWFIPLVGLAGNFVWQKRQDFRAANAGLVRRSQAAKQAKRALGQARKNQTEAYAAAGQILNTYLSARLGRPLPGLTEYARTELLTEQGVAPALVERINQSLSCAEWGSYAPETADPEQGHQLLADVEILIHDVEISFGRK